MGSIRVVTDSACDLSPTMAEERDVRVVPLTIRFGSEELVDRDELSGKEFWDRVITGPDMPATAAPSPGAFQQAFLEASAGGRAGVVCATISSGLSGHLPVGVHGRRGRGRPHRGAGGRHLSVRTGGQGLWRSPPRTWRRRGAGLDDIAKASRTREWPDPHLRRRRQPRLPAPRGPHRRRCASSSGRCCRSSP